MFNKLAFAALSVLAAAPALAAPPPPPPPPPVCSITDVSPSAVACVGWIEGNLINGSPADVLAQQNALSTLGLAWTPPWLEKKDFASGNTITFDTVMNGITYIGMHLGAANGATNPPGLGTEASAFFRFDFATPTNSITVNYAGLSNAALYATQPVPEPETYALLLAGLAGVGFMARRRKTV